jgi:hypothetical protein
MEQFNLNGLHNFRGASFAVAVIDNIQRTICLGSGKMLMYRIQNTAKDGTIAEKKDTNYRTGHVTPKIKSITISFFFF